ncbi:hypothetical protein DXG03_005680 [Asterophora parasitica]|uniref:MFS general substrate transporter n=1 Tax=Asterophora parasitica TaxID=117018 RepID=A0A9P7KAV1_9AGAR|nr:hypothetical protein DXG03_005680 [Asterophora parasitica]
MQGRAEATRNNNFSIIYGLHEDNTADEGGDDDRHRSPANRCIGDPAVQAGAARLQTMMTTTMGLLSALTTGWWGHFGERHGRTKVLAIVTLGLFITDLTFILVSNPASPFSQYGHALLVLAPIIEGVLGGWSTLQSATSAYLSDCTSSGSRAYIFSRFAGVFYIGLSAGPSLGGYLIRNPLFPPPPGTEGRLSVTSVFWVAVFCSAVNFLLVLCVFPESLDKVKRQRALEEHRIRASIKGSMSKVRGESVVAEGSGGGAEEDEESEGIIRGFLKPLALFLPATVYEGGGRKRRDWSLTFLAAALFGATLSNGVHQVKYLYAVHVYEWGAGQLSYYISFLSGARALFLLFLCPWIIATFKPKPPHVPHSDADAPVTAKAKKPKPTKAHLAREISFDLVMTRFSLMIDILSNTFVTLGPMPVIHALGGGTRHSQSLFVLATALSSLGSGAGPAMQSLALCITQVRGLDAAAESGGKDATPTKDGGVGQLFGALAVLQTLGQMILGPMLFGLVYSGTVAAFPKAVFVTAAGLLVCSLVLVILVRGPAMPTAELVPGRSHKKGKRKAREYESRGRSRVNKDLRGGATGYGTVASSSSA